MGAERIKSFIAMRVLDTAKLIFRHPEYHKIIAEMNTQAQKSGLPDAARVLAKKALLKVETVWDEQPVTEEILRKKPVIIVANHEFLIEPLILLSQLPSRKNLFAVAADFAGDFFGGAVQELFLPISLKRNSVANQINAASIKYAGKLLHEKNAIVILPKPTSKPEKWRTGIGKIIGNFLGREDIFLVMADIQGIKEKDIMKLLLNTTGVTKNPLNYNLRISKPIAIKDLGMEGLPGDSKEEIREITNRLQNYYEKWLVVS